jgi:peptide deformylase
MGDGKRLYLIESAKLLCHRYKAQAVGIVLEHRDKLTAALKAGNDAARIIQHEYDHLEGKVFTDRVSPLRRNLLKGKMTKLASGKYRCAYKTK